MRKSIFWQHVILVFNLYLPALAHPPPSMEEGGEEKSPLKPVEHVVLEDLAGILGGF